MSTALLRIGMAAASREVEDSSLVLQQLAVFTFVCVDIATVSWPACLPCLISPSVFTPNDNFSWKFALKMLRFSFTFLTGLAFALCCFAMFALVENFRFVVTLRLVCATKRTSWFSEGTVRSDWDVPPPPLPSLNMIFLLIISYENKTPPYFENYAHHVQGANL